MTLETNSSMLARERRARLLCMAASTRSDLARNPYPELSEAARKAALATADRWEKEANEHQA
jgi:hypothetical protein